MLAHGFGNLLVDSVHNLALFAIGGTIVWSAVHAFIMMMTKGGATIDAILLLFIYLELGAMVGIYFKTNHMPVRFLIYVAMTALTRMMISDIPFAILVLVLATLMVRYGSAKFPSDKSTSSP